VLRPPFALREIKIGVMVRPHSGVSDSIAGERPIRGCLGASCVRNSDTLDREHASSVLLAW
jgi:hypothetical protein